MSAGPLIGAPLLGIVSGMQSELETLGPWRNDPRIAVAVSGARPGRAEAEARRLVVGGCRALLSWGIAGGLDPALTPGTLVVGEAVVDERGARDPLAVIEGVAPVTLAGLDHPVFLPDEKTSLRATSGAVAVDMETHRLARVGADAGCRVFAVRAIADPAERGLPRLVQHALDESGRPRIGRVLRELLARPADLRAILRVKKETDEALAALERAAPDVIGEIVALVASSLLPGPP